MISKFKLLLAVLFVGICVVVKLQHSMTLIQHSATLTKTHFHLRDFNKCPTPEERWFMKLLNKSVEPFLSQHHAQSEDLFNWWKHLQPSSNFSDYTTIVEKLFQMLPHSPDVTGCGPDHCRTCAVVGNSGNLKGSHYGRFIDQHDIIMRINRARTKGYESDVGTITTHHIMYPESAVDLDNTTHLVMFLFKNKDLDWLLKALTSEFYGVTYATVKRRIKFNKDLVMVLNPEFMKYVHENWMEKKGAYPSTGFMTLIAAMHICNRVSLF